MIFFFQGAIMEVFGLLALILGAAIMGSMPAAFAGLVAVFAFIFMGIGTLYIWVGVGFLKQREWARIVGIVLGALGMLGVLGSLAAGDFLSVVIGLALSGTVLGLCVTNRFDPRAGAPRAFAKARPARRGSMSPDYATDYGADDDGYDDEADDYAPTAPASPRQPAKNTAASPTTRGPAPPLMGGKPHSMPDEFDAMTIPRTGRGRHQANQQHHEQFASDPEAATMPRAGRGRQTRAMNTSGATAVPHSAPFALQTAQPGVQACPHCNGQIDVSEFEPGTVFACPHCQNAVQVA